MLLSTLIQKWELGKPYLSYNNSWNIIESGANKKAPLFLSSNENDKAIFEPLIQTFVSPFGLYHFQ